MRIGSSSRAGRVPFAPLPLLERVVLVLRRCGYNRHMDRWKTVETEIEDFRRYLAPSFPPIQITEGYDFRWSQDEYKRWRKERPYQCCGVYLFYDSAGTLLHVGKALWTFDKRLWTHQIGASLEPPTPPRAVLFTHRQFGVNLWREIFGRGFSRNVANGLGRDGGIPSRTFVCVRCRRCGRTDDARTAIVASLS